MKLWLTHGVTTSMAMTSEKSVDIKAAAHGPARFRCLISGLATGSQVVIFACLRLLDWPPEHRLLLWGWVIAVNIGITFGVYGLCSARNWGERILAISLLCFQFLLLWILFLIGVAAYVSAHGTFSIH